MPAVTLSRKSFTLSRKDKGKEPADTVTAEPAPQETPKPLPDLNDLQGGAWFTAKDGCEVYYKTWKPTVPIVATLLAIHGFGEHINRYDPLFTHFASNGIAVRGLDLRGHGRTHVRNIPKGSLQGYMGTFKNVFEDLILLNDMEIEGLPKKGEVPMFVFGHSMGGLIALSLVNGYAGRLRNFRGVIAQAPCIRTARTFPSLLNSTIKTLGNLLPRITQPAGAMDLDAILDPSLHEAYKQDPYNHAIMSLRLLRDFITYGTRLEKSVKEFTYPILIYHSKVDKLTSCEASVGFINECGSEDKDIKVFEGARHELHFESTLRDQITQDYTTWILTRAQKATPPLPAKDKDTLSRTPTKKDNNTNNPITTLSRKLSQRFTTKKEYQEPTTTTVPEPPTDPAPSPSPQTPTREVPSQPEPEQPTQNKGILGTFFATLTRTKETSPPEAPKKDEPTNHEPLKDTAAAAETEQPKEEKTLPTVPPAAES